jgi:sigma-54 dependent transcriptional regulator, acetoin dehydrogenase operon transcriptional activator AcoR
MLINKQKIRKTFRFKAWQEFTQKGILTQPIKNSLALASWQRCLKNDKDPRGENISPMLPAKEIESLLSKNFLLIKASRSNLQNLERSLESIPHAILMSDHEGNIIYHSGTGRVFDYFHQVGLAVGGNCSENVLGTTAPGIVLVEKKPTLVLREEHYSKIYHWCCCVAAPIFSFKGDLVGCLDITTHYDHFAYINFLLGLNIATVKGIQSDLHVLGLHEEVEGVREILKSTADLTSYGLMVVNENGIILHANQRVNNLLNISVQRFIGSNYRQVIESDAILSCLTREKIAQGKVTFAHAIDKKKFLSLQARPLHNKIGQFIGSLLIFEEETKQPVITTSNKDLHGPPLCDIVGETPAIKKAISLAQKFASVGTTILLEGETGTGKELFAQTIHKLSDRAEGPFIPINCAAIPPDLFESELFGYSAGAFTGAIRSGKKGKFELAGGGTLFLDEINHMPLHLQAKLLRAVEGGGFIPLGAQMNICTDVRIIAASGLNIEKETQQGRFLKELFYRLTLVRIFLPPLRERMQDLKQLVSLFFEESARKLQKNLSFISPEVMQQLYSYDWPGNIRQLKSCIEFMVCIADGENILLEHLPDYFINRASRENINQTGQKNTDHLNRWQILQAIESTRGRIGEAAKILGISRSTIYRKRNQLGLGKSQQK